MSLQVLRSGFVVPFVFMIASVSAAQGTDKIISEKCARRDLDLVTEIETARDTRLPAMRLVTASKLMFEARELCYANKEALGLRLYETVIRMLRDHPVYFRETGD